MKKQIYSHTALYCSILLPGKSLLKKCQGKIQIENFMDPDLDSLNDL
jgi:hypothetical protein